MLKKKVIIDPIVCRCGSKWGEHKVEISYIIKDKCVTCGFSLPGTEGHFNQMGNFCNFCSGLADKMARKWITQEAALQEIAFRKKKVEKDNKINP